MNIGNVKIEFHLKSMYSYKCVVIIYNTRV